MEKSNIFNTKNILNILMIVLILLQTGNLLYCFLCEKNGVHSDEIYSYATANSAYEPFLSMTGRQDYSPKNNGQWLDGRVFDDYLSVNTEERFQYDYIIHNENDIHAPLYFMILHTICSFFPESFSWWYGFSINLVLFVASILLLYFIVRNITKNAVLAFMTCLFYGFSQSAVNTFIYIRMYSMMTFLGLLSFYLHVLLYQKPDKFKKILPGIVLVTFLGGLTHLHFLVFAGMLSAFFCIYYLLTKQYRRMFIYGFSQIFAVAAFLCVHPYVLDELFAVTEKQAISTVYGGVMFELRMLMSIVCKELFGIAVTTRPSYFAIYVIEAILVILTIGLPACFLLRKEIKKYNVIPSIVNRIKDVVKYVKDTVDIMIIPILIIPIGFFYVVAATSYVFSMGDYATRYVFMMYPYIIISIVLIFNAVIFIFEKVISFGILVFKKKKISNRFIEIIRNIILLIGILLLLTNIRYNASKSFYFKESDLTEIKLNELPREANYIISLNEYWLLDYLSYPLRGVNSFFAVEQSRFFETKEELELLNSEKPVYFILSCPKWKDLIAGDGEDNIQIDEEFINMLGSLSDIENQRVKSFVDKYEQFCLDLNFCNVVEYIGKSEIFGRSVFVFLLQ